MNEFGQWLRFYRERCHDPATRRGRLSQARLGELLGEKIGIEGYSGAAVSEWERGRSKIDADDRLVLVSLVQVLREHSGIRTLTEANTFLMSGNYRPLDAEEQRRVFPEAAEQPPASGPDPPDQLRLVIIFLREIIFRPTEEAREAIKKLGEGPPPQWPRILLSVLGWPMRHVSIYAMLRATLWIGAWLLTLWLVFPLMQWPFDGEADARRAAVMFALGTLAIPLLVGSLIDTDHSDFWQTQRKLARPGVIRLYTHQGSLIGFQISCMALFATALMLYYVGLDAVSIWLANFGKAISAAGLLTFAYASARQVPLNLWRAYGAVRLADGAIFFSVILLGPAWGLFFLNFYPLLLSVPTGAFTVFLAILTLVGAVAWQHRRTGSTIIPAHWWVAFFGAVIALRLIENGAELRAILTWAGLTIALTALTAWILSIHNRRG